MFIRFFKTNQPATLFAIPFIAIIGWLPAFWNPHSEPVTYAMPLYVLLIHLLESLPPYAHSVLGIGMVSTAALYLNTQLNVQEVLFKKSYLPALFFCVLFSAIPSLLWIHPALPAAFLMVFVIGKIFRIYKNDHSLPIIFDIGLLTSMATLFYLPSVLFMLIFFVSLIVLRPFVWREWIVSMLGFVLPLLFCWIYYFWMDQTTSLFSSLENYMSADRAILKNVLNGSNLMMPVMLILICLLAAMKLTGNFFKNVIRTRNFQQVLLSSVVIFAAPTFILRDVYPGFYLFISVPISIFVSYYFLAVKRLWWSEILFLIFVGGIILLHLR